MMAEYINEKLATESNRIKINVSSPSRIKVSQGCPSKSRTLLSPPRTLESFGSISPGWSSSSFSEEKDMETSFSRLSYHSARDLCNIPAEYSSKRSSKGKCKNPVQQGIVLDVAAIHNNVDRQNTKSDGNNSTSVHSLSVSPSPKLAVSGITGSKSRLRPTLHVTHSPSPSLRSNYLQSKYSPSPSLRSNFKSGHESEGSSIYESSCMYPHEDCLKLDGSLPIPRTVDVNHARRMSTPCVSSQRPRSSQGIYSLQSSQLTVSPSRMRRNMEMLNCTSFPYIPSMEIKHSRKVRESNNVQKNADKEPEEPSLICSQGLSGACRNISEDSGFDQTCRLNIGVVASLIFFIFFLWYLVMVYKRFINHTSYFDTSGTRSPELQPIQEVVVNISAEDLGA